MVVGAYLEISHQEGFPTNLLQRPAADVAETCFIYSPSKVEIACFKAFERFGPSPGRGGRGPLPTRSLIQLQI